MSQSGRDPFLGLLRELRADADERQRPGVCVGKIVALTATTIRIQADGLELDEEDVLISADLAPGYTETGTLTVYPGGLTGPCQLSAAAACEAGGAHDAITVMGMAAGSLAQTGSYAPESRLAAGDHVLLLPTEDRQLYYIVAKVVRYGTFPAD